MRLLGKTAIITGAGSGFGRASAYLFAREGARLVVTDINSAAVEQTAITIKSGGGEAFHIHADVQDAKQVKELATVKTGHRMFRQIRTILDENNDSLLNGEVEVDETYVGGKRDPG